MRIGTIVRALAVRVGLAAVARVEEVRTTDAVDLPEPFAHVLVVARGEEPAARPVKRVHR